MTSDKSQRQPENATAIGRVSSPCGEQAWLEPEPSMNAKLTQVTYEGSPYHKRYQSRWGPAAHFSDKTECPVDVSEDEAIRVLVSEIARSLHEGDHSKLMDGKWPRWVWGRSRFEHTDGQLYDIAWEARIVNREGPSYKAYPMDPTRHYHEMPKEVRDRIWPR